MLVRCPRRVRRTGQTGNPWVGVARPVRSPAPLLAAGARLLRARRGARTSSPPASSCCSSASASPRCSAPATCRPTSTPSTPVAVPGLSSIPFLGDDLLRPGPAHLPRPTSLVPALWWFLFRTRWGLLLRAAGERSEVLATYGHRRRADPLRGRDRRRRPRRHRRGPALDRLHQRLVREHGRRAAGFIAVALVIFAARQPFKVAGRRVPVRRRPRPLARAPGPRLRHQPVRPRRHPLRAHARRARPARPPPGGRRARGAPEGLRSLGPLAADAPRPRARRRRTRAVDPGHADPGADTRQRFPRKRNTCADVGSQRRLLALLALVAVACGSSATSSADGVERHRIVERRPARQGRHDGRLHLRRPEGRLRLQPGRLRGQPGHRRGLPRHRRSSPPRTCPRTTTPRRVMEAMIDNGAEIIFATSYGHLDPAIKVAEPPTPTSSSSSRATSSRATSCPTSAPTSAPCTSPSTSPASPPEEPPRPTSSATSTPSRSPRRSPTSTPSRWAPSR